MWRANEGMGGMAEVAIVAVGMTAAIVVDIGIAGTVSMIAGTVSMIAAKEEEDIEIEDRTLIVNEVTVAEDTIEEGVTAMIGVLLVANAAPLDTEDAP